MGLTDLHRHMLLGASCGWIAACVLAAPAGAHDAGAPADAAFVGRFAPGGESLPDDWKVVQLDRHVSPTRYSVQEWDGVEAVVADANDSMSLLARSLDIDLSRTPVLCWRWRIDAPLKSADMAEKRGDDYAARVYVALRLPREALGFATRTKLALARGIYGDKVPDAALNYVWDNRNPVGTVRPNAYTDRAQMIVQRTGEQDTGRWVVERRNVLDDAQRLFGPYEMGAALLAVASDTDNTHETARAGFADLHFVAPEAACHFDEETIR